jgi:hypothetical protein
VFNLAFSPAPRQDFVFVADGANDRCGLSIARRGWSSGRSARTAGMAEKCSHFIDGVASLRFVGGIIYTGEVECPEMPSLRSITPSGSRASASDKEVR